MTLNLSTKTSKAVNWLCERPISHRGLHDRSRNICENTLSAAVASVRKNYPIELDLQPTKDWVPMVFHDRDLERMTGVMGNIRETTKSELDKIPIKGTTEPIPSLADFLATVSGQVGLVIELKGIPDADDGFVAAVTETLQDYQGDIVLMSFEHHILEEIRETVPHIPLGLTAFGKDDRYELHRSITERLDLDFISYHIDHLDTQFVSEFRETGRPIISWTVTSQEKSKFSDKFADQITFEDFLP